MRHVIHLCVLASLLMSSDALANCRIENSNDLLSSIKNNHPDLSLSPVENKIARKLIDEAKERPNPELELSGVKGEDSDGDTTKTAVSIVHTVELGGKLDARVDLATKVADQAKFELREQSEDILIDIVLKLYRLRQVNELIPIYEEAHDAFSKIIKTKGQRKTLSPEELVEKETLILVANDYKLKVAKLRSEQSDLNSHISLFIGEKCELKNSVLPGYIEFRDRFSKSKTDYEYSKILRARAVLEMSKSRFDYEKSRAYSDLKIKPTFEIEKSDGKNYQSIGLSLSMELPLFNRNNANKQMANLEMERDALKLKNIELEADIDKRSWEKKYNSFKRSLMVIATKKELDEKHNRIETLFKRGIISTSLVIESHRQLIEFASTRFEFELGAVEALWNIYKINGTLLEEKI